MSWRIAAPVLLLAACGSPDGTGSSPSAEDALFHHADVIDLTHALSPSMPAWGGDNPFRHDTIAAHADGSPSMAAYFTPEHHGTHLDAPVHGAQGARSVDQLTAGDLFGPAVVIDVSEESGADPDYELSRQDVLDWEARHGPVPDGAVVVMKTGWASRWSNPETYFNRDAEGVMHFPGFSTEAARFLVEEREIRGIGIDDPSVDPGAAHGFPVHGIVNPAGKYQLENLADLSRLPATGAYLLVAPIKIEGGSGGQVRVWAVVPRL